MGDPLDTAQDNGNETVVDFGVSSAPEVVQREQGNIVRPVLVVFDRSDLYVWHAVHGEVTRIGREGNLELLVPDETISRLHAQVIYTNHDRPTEEPICRLQDMGSRNGSYLNGTKVEGTPVLENGDRISIGKTSLVYYIRSEQEIDSDKKMRALATRDALTGLLNRGFMSMQFQREFDRAHRYGRPMCLLMIDIDNFKIVNDTYGHQVGDAVLEQVAQHIAARIRVHDVAGRYGGEEFAVVLPETPVEGGMQLAERIRENIAEYPILAMGHELHITASIGVATREAFDDRIDSVIRRADMALLAAKGAGKNCVILHEEEEENTPSM